VQPVGVEPDDNTLIPTGSAIFVSFKNRIGAVLNQFQYLSVTVTAAEYSFLDAVILANTLRITVSVKICLAALRKAPWQRAWIQRYQD
jgi:hypothetical protein